MFRTCTHSEVAPSLEAINAVFAILEIKKGGSARSTTLVSANSMFMDITSKPILECVGHSLDIILPRYIEKQIRACLEFCLAKNFPQEGELIIDRESSNRWWRLLITPLLVNDDGNHRMIATLIEITEKKQLEHQLNAARERYEAVVETAYDGIITVDQNQTIMLMNESARDIFGVGADEHVIGEQLGRFIPQRFRDKHAEYVSAFKKSEIKVRPMQTRSSIFGLRTDGIEIPIEVTISKIKFNSSTELTATIRDISEQTKLIEDLQKASTHDSLTEIYNRRHGDALLNSEFHRSLRYSHPLTLAMVDLDHFKDINDRHGHLCGDVVLKSLVETLSGSLRDTDYICRWGGEEFLVMLPETQLAEAQNWAERTRKAIASQEILVAGGQAIKITVSFGLAMNSSNNQSAEALLKRADSALYIAKEKGRNQVVADEG